MTSTLTPSEAGTAATTGSPRSRAERVALTVLLVASALLLLWDLSINQWGNSFYAGAVQAMTRNWEAFFFGSSDAGLTITVDKPPLSLWVMALSARIFGFSSWSILVPQALMGVGAVALLYAAVRRVSGPRAALLAGSVLALTPVAVLMFRFDNPDALLTLLMVASAYAVVRALEHASTRWLLLAGGLLGLAFLTKTAQALLVLPGLALAYAWAAPTGFWRRIRQLLTGGAVMVVVGGWWFAIVDLWPSGTRPYIGGSVGDSAVELALGYNGLGRIFGNEFGGSGGGSGGGFPGAGGMPGGFSPFGAAGPARLFTPDIAGQISWLLPAALILTVAGLVLTRLSPRTDPTRASLIIWGGWTIVTAAVFSLMQGIFHQYYTVALAPGIAAVVGIGGAVLWQRRDRRGARLGLAGIVLLSTVLAVVIVLIAGLATWLLAVIAAAGLAATALLATAGRRAAAAGLAAAIAAASLGPLAFDVETLRTAETSAIPLAGPAGGGLGGFAAMIPGLPAGAMTIPGEGAMAGGGAADPALVTLLRTAGTPWAAATTSASGAADLALASRSDVMGIGGFLGSDPAPSLAQFEADATAGKIRYFVDGGPFGMAGGFDPAEMIATLPPAVRDNPQVAGMIEQFEKGGTPTANPFGTGGPGTAITEWVKQHYRSQQIGGRTVYDLTAPVR